MTTAALFVPPKKWAPDPWPEPAPPAFDFDRNEPAVIQSADWTCSCASLAWTMNALGVEAPDGGKWDEWDGVNELRRIAGYSAVSPDYGLAYGNGQDLERVYNAYGFSVVRQSVSWADLAYFCELGVGQLGGARWYHWTGSGATTVRYLTWRIQPLIGRVSAHSWTRPSGMPGAAGPR